MWFALLASSFALGQDFQCDGQDSRDYRDLRADRFDCCPDQHDFSIYSQGFDSESGDDLDPRQNQCDFPLRVKTLAQTVATSATTDPPNSHSRAIFLAVGQTSLWI